MRFQTRIYRMLLVAYPRVYRNEYGPPMTQLFADRVRDEGGGLRTLGLWIQVLVDLVRTAFSEHMETTMKNVKTGWWRVLALPLALFVAVAGVGLPFEPEDTAGPNWLRGAILYAIAAVAGFGLVVSGTIVRRRNRKIGSTMIAVGVMPGFPMAIMFWYPPVAAVGVLAIAIAIAALLDAPKAPQSVLEVSR